MDKGESDNIRVGNRGPRNAFWSWVWRLGASRAPLLTTDK